MAKRTLAHLVKRIGVFLSFCGVTGICLLLLSGAILKKLFAHKTNEFDYTVQWALKDNHLYFVLGYVFICLLAIVLLRLNYIKQNRRLQSVKKIKPV